MSLKLKGRESFGPKQRVCGECGNYDVTKHKCTLFKRKLAPSYYCEVDGNTVYFLNSSH
jgi:hypothetical protein